MGRFDIRTRSGQISAIIQTQGGTSIDPDAQAFFNRVTAAGGTLSVTEQNAVNTLTSSLKSAGIWTLMKAVYPMVGASAAACSQNLVSSSFTGTFSSGWTFTSLGVTPNGTSAYMDTALTPSITLSLNSTHLSFYSRTDTASSSIADIGSFGNSNYTLIELFGNNFYNLINQSGTASNNPMTTSLGHFIGSRTTSTLLKSYRNGTSFGTHTTTSGALSNAIITLAAFNNAGSLQFYSNRQYSFASIGDGLSDAQAFDFYAAVQTFQTSLSRNV